MKKLFFLFLVAFVFVGCKPTVGVDNSVDEPVDTPTKNPETPVEDPWALAVYNEADADFSVSYIYVPKGWNPVDFNKDVYEQFSGRTEENFDFLKFEKVGTLAFNSTDEDVIKANSTHIFSKRVYYNCNEPDVYYTEIDCYKVSVKKDFDLDFICMIYDDLNCYNALMNQTNDWSGYTLEKSESGTWYIYACLWNNANSKKKLYNRANPNDYPKYPKMAIANYN